MTRVPILALLLIAATGTSNLVVRSLLAAQTWPQPPVLLACGLALAQVALAAAWCVAACWGEGRKATPAWRWLSTGLLGMTLCFWAETLTSVTPASLWYWLLLLGLHALLVGAGCALADFWRQVRQRDPHGNSAPAAARRQAGQFSLAALLGAMTLTGLLLGLARWGQAEQYGIASLCGFCAITAAVASLSLAVRRLGLALTGIVLGALLLPMTGLTPGHGWSLVMLLGIEQGYLLLADGILRIEQHSLTGQGIQSAEPVVAAGDATRLALIRT